MHLPEIRRQDSKRNVALLDLKSRKLGGKGKSNGLTKEIIKQKPFACLAHVLRRSEFKHPRYC